MENLFQDKDYNLWVLLSNTRYEIFKARQKELAPNVYVRHAAVIIFIASNGGEATPGEISSVMIRQPHSVSELLNRMEKQGLVKRVNDINRNNRVKVVLTEKGREVYHQASKIDSIQTIMSVLSEEEREQLTSSLSRLRNKAKAYQHDIEY